MKLELRIGNEYIIDLDTEIVSVNFNLRDIKEYDKRKTSFSKPFRIFNTSSTAKVFKQAYNLNRVDGYPIRNKVTAELLEDGITILKGYLYLEDIKSDYYEVVMSNNDIGLIQDVGDRYIHELVFPEGLYSHSVTKSHILSEWARPNYINENFGLKYTLIDFDNHINSADDLKQDYPIMPSVHAWEILHKIATDNGYTIEIEELDLVDKLSKIVIPCNRDITEYLGEFEYRKSHFYNQSQNVSMSPVRFTFLTGDYDNLDGDVAGIQRDMVIAATGKYRIKLSIRAKGQDSLAVSGVVWDEVHPLYGSGIVFDDIDMTSNLEVTEQEIEVFLRRGQKLRLSMFWRQGYKEGNQVHSDSYIQLTKLDYFYNGQTLDINDVLPLGYKQKDFLKDIITSFNLHVTVDDFDEKKLYLRTYGKFYDGSKILDWSNKIDMESLSISDLSNQLSREFVFTHSSDKDAHNEDYNDKFNESFNTHTRINGSEFSKGTTEIKTTFPATAVKTVTDNIFLPAIYMKKGAREHKARLMFLNRFSPPGSAIMNGPSFSTYAYTCTPYMNMDTSENDLYLGFDNGRGYMAKSTETTGWGMRTGRTLFDVYYRNEVLGNLNKGYKILKADFMLNILDARPENLRAIIYLYGKKIGGSYFRINSITGYRKGKACTVELTEIDLNYMAGITTGGILQEIITLNPDKIDEL